MAVQTTYAQNHSAAYAGGRADSGPAHMIAALNKQGAEIPYGYGVVIKPGGSNANLTTLKPNDYVPAGLPGASTDVILGVCLHDHAHDPNNTNGVKDGDMFSILRAGLVYVVTAVAVKPGDPVYLWYATGTGAEVVGTFGIASDTNKNTLISQARWAGYASAAGIVALELLLP